MYYSRVVVRYIYEKLKNTTQTLQRKSNLVHPHTDESSSFELVGIFAMRNGTLNGKKAEVALNHMIRWINRKHANWLAQVPLMIRLRLGLCLNWNFKLSY